MERVGRHRGDGSLTALGEKKWDTRPPRATLSFEGSYQLCRQLPVDIDTGRFME